MWLMQSQWTHQRLSTLTRLSRGAVHLASPFYVACVRACSCSFGARRYEHVRVIAVTAAGESHPARLYGEAALRATPGPPSEPTHVVTQVVATRALASQTNGDPLHRTMPSTIIEESGSFMSASPSVNASRASLGGFSTPPRASKSQLVSSGSDMKAVPVGAGVGRRSYVACWLACRTSCVV